MGILHTYEWFLIAHSEISCKSYPNFIFARTNACTNPQCAVELWTCAGGVHVFVQAFILTLPCVGNSPLKGRSPIQLSEVTVWSIWKGMWKSFIFLDLSWSIFTASFPLSKIKKKNQTKKKEKKSWNKTEQTLWMTFLKNTFDYIASPLWFLIMPDSCFIYPLRKG